MPPFPLLLRLTFSWGSGHVAVFGKWHRRGFATRQPRTASKREQTRGRGSRGRERDGGWRGTKDGEERTRKKEREKAHAISVQRLACSTRFHVTGALHSVTSRGHSVIDQLEGAVNPLTTRLFVPLRYRDLLTIRQSSHQPLGPRHVTIAGHFSIIPSRCFHGVLPLILLYSEPELMESLWLVGFSGV